jgi:hypothetical protein
VSRLDIGRLHLPSLPSLCGGSFLSFSSTPSSSRLALSDHPTHFTFSYHPSPASFLQLPHSNSLLSTTYTSSNRIGSVRSGHRTPSLRLGLSTPRTTVAEGDHTHTIMQQDDTQDQQEKVDTADKPAESARPPAESNMRAVRTMLIPKICDILKDFPTAPDDESFQPLLRQLVKVTVANQSQAMEEKHLDLATHVIVHSTSTSPTDQVDTGSLVRPVLRILSRHRQKMATDTHSQLQRDMNIAARANDLGRLRAIHA